MKNLALLKYQIMFDPAESWSNGYQFENQLADFFAAHGFEAQIIAPQGGTGDRVIWLERVYSPQTIAKEVPKESKPVQDQIKQVQTQQPTKSFKQFQERGVPRSFVNQYKRSPKPTFHVGRTNRQKVRIPNGS